MSKDSPLVSFAKGALSFDLGRSGTDRAAHLYGSQGLGVAPVDIGKSDRLAGDGSIVRGVRFGDRDVFVPVLLQAPTMGDLHLLRRELTRVVAPVSGDPEGSRVTVRIEDPSTGTVRTILGIYREGLEGDFGDGYHAVWQTVGLVFDCPDPWWLGEDRTASMSLGGGAKPFLSDTVDFFPVMLAESAVAGDLVVRVEGDAAAAPVWEITGPGEDLVIESEAGRIQIDGEFAAGEVVRVNTVTGRITPDRWDDTSLDSRLFHLPVGTSTIHVSMVGATTDTMVRLVWQERWLEAV